MKKISESEIEKYFCWIVEMNGGKTWKFKSPAQRGVADRIACLPNGNVYMVELKTKGGKLSELQKLFAKEMGRLNVPYECLWTVEQIDAFISRISTKLV
jgi:ribosomal protein S6